MECYFAIKQQVNTNLELDSDDNYHITKVLRHQLGDEIVVIYQQQKYRAKIINLQPNVICQIITPINELIRELPIKITLVMALLKEQKFDDVIKKAVELGVSSIVPIQLTRSISVIKDQAQNDKKVARWQKVAKAAAKQANRHLIPTVESIIKLSEVQHYRSDINYVAYENAQQENDWSNNCLKKSSITIVIGPEGGITESEIVEFQKLNFDLISLGKTILRAETAPLYFLAVINHLFSQKSSERQ